MPLQPPLPRSSEQSSNRLPGLALWQAEVMRAWAVLAVLAVVAGALWRVLHSAPPLEHALDAAGLALAASAYWLAPALEQVLAGLRRHQSSWLPNPRLLPQVLLAVAGAGVVLATAPLGLLLAYDASAIIAQGGATDGVVYRVPLWGMLALILLLLGPGLVVLAAGLLAVLRAVLRPGLGAALWLAVLLVCHAGLADVPWWTDQPVTLGGMLQWLSQLFGSASQDPAQALYITELLWAMVTPTLLELCAALLVLALALVLVRRTAPPLPLWIVPGLAVTAALTRGAVQTLYWMHDMSRRGPGDWFGVLTTGLLVLLLSHWLLAWNGQTPAGWRNQIRELAWGWSALAAGACCTAPYIWAGQTQHAAVLWGLLGVIASASPLLLLLARLGLGWRESPKLRAVLLTAVLPLLVAPVTDSGATVITALARTIASAGQQADQRQACCWLVGCLVGACLLLWPWPRRTLRRPAPAQAPV